MPSLESAHSDPLPPLPAEVPIAADEPRPRVPSLTNTGQMFRSSLGDKEARDWWDGQRERCAARSGVSTGHSPVSAPGFTFPSGALTRLWDKDWNLVASHDDRPAIDPGPAYVIGEDFTVGAVYIAAVGRLPRWWNWRSWLPRWRLRHYRRRWVSVGYVDQVTDIEVGADD